MKILHLVQKNQKEHVLLSFYFYFFFQIKLINYSKKKKKDQTKSKVSESYYNPVRSTRTTNKVSNYAELDDIDLV